jgi:uncharacterized protein
MLIDINAYTGHWPFRQLKYNTCETRLQLMDQFGVDISVISNLNGVFYKNTQPANMELYEEMKSNRRFRDRFIPFAVINPIYSGWQDDFKESIEKMGMKGIRLYPTYHGYDLNDPSCIELVKMAQDRDLPVALSLRMVDKRVSSWLDIDQEWSLKDVVPIIRALPDAKYLILNVANSTQLSKEETEIYKKANIVIDTSGRQIVNLGELLNKYGKDKFAFGSHSPILDYRTGLLRIESLREDEADERTKELLRSGNIKRILGI